MPRFHQIAAGVHVLRHPVLDVNSGLVVGDRRALLIDTLSTPSQARDLAAAVREVTRLPITVVNTHHHFDHVFGNATVQKLLGVTEFWAHRLVAARLHAHGDRERAQARRTCAQLAPEIAEEVAVAELTAPNQRLDHSMELDLGNRTVVLRHPGPGHTHGDVAVLDSLAVFAGDLLESGADPSVEEDSDLAHWPLALDVLLPDMNGPVVPGHGAVVDREFARRQRDALAAQATSRQK